MLTIFLKDDALQEIIQKDETFELSPDALVVFKNLKEKMTSTPVRTVGDPDLASDDSARRVEFTNDLIREPNYHKRDGIFYLEVPWALRQHVRPTTTRTLHANTAKSYTSVE